MNLDSEILAAVARVAVVGGIGGLLGGLVASRRASVTGSLLMGVIGGIVGSAILRLVNADPLIDAGHGFSYVYGLAGGVLLGLVVSASNR